MMLQMVNEAEAIITNSNRSSDAKCRPLGSGPVSPISAALCDHGTRLGGDLAT
jgi:hypothetical protein